jgi:hypothetical protein
MHQRYSDCRFRITVWVGTPVQLDLWHSGIHTKPSLFAGDDFLKNPVNAKTAMCEIIRVNIGNAGLYIGKFYGLVSAGYNAV